jgi:hypothetical protein
VTAFSTGGVLARSLAIWAKHLAPFLLLTLLVTLPGHALHYLIEEGRFSFGEEALDQGLPGLIDTVLITMAAGAICWGVFQELRAKPVGFARCVAVGLARLAPTVLVGLTAGLVIGVGLLLLIVPGLVLACVLYVVVPAAVIEGGGVAASMQRSAELTAGHRWPVFFIGLTTILLNLVAAMLAIAAFGTAGGALWTARIGLGVGFASFSAVTSTVAYYQLRVVREGRAPDDVADVFE